MRSSSFQNNSFPANSSRNQKKRSLDEDDVDHVDDESTRLPPYMDFDFREFKWKGQQVKHGKKIQFIVKNGKLIVDHVGIRFEEEDKRTFTLNPKKFRFVNVNKNGNGEIHTDGFSVVFSDQGKYFEIKDYIDIGMKLRDGTPQQQKSKKVAKPSTHSYNQEAHLPPPIPNRYASPAKAVTVSRAGPSAPSTSSSVPRPKEQLVSSPSPNRVLPRRDFSNGALKENFQEVSVVKATLDFMKTKEGQPATPIKQATQTPPRSRESRSAIENILVSPLKYDPISKYQNEVGKVQSLEDDDDDDIEEPDEPPVVLQKKLDLMESMIKPSTERKQFGKASMWSTVFSQSMRTKPIESELKSEGNPFSSPEKSKTSTETTTSISGKAGNSSGRGGRFASTQASTSKLATSSEEDTEADDGRSSPLPKFDATKTKQISSFFSSTGGSSIRPRANFLAGNSAIALEATSKLTPRKETDDHGDDDDHATNPLPEFDATKNKQIKTFFSTTTRDLVTDRLFTSSSSSISFTSRSVYKGGIRNLGNSCYMSSVIQSLFTLKEFSEDITSTFWINIIENQLILKDESLSNTSNLSAKILYRNESSCLSEFIHILRQKKEFDKENSSKFTSIPSIISTLPSSKDIFDLSSFKRTIGQLMSQFANYSQQDTQEFFLSFLSELDEEMSIRLQYFLHDLLFQYQKQHQQLDNTKGDEIIGSSMVSPVSISNIPKTVQKAVNADRSANETNESISDNLITNNTTNTTMRSPSDTKPDLKTVATSSSSSSSSSFIPPNAALLPYYSNSSYLSSLTRQLIPTNIYFDNLLEVNMTCQACQKQFPPKYEHYHDFSFDFDKIIDQQHQQQLDQQSSDKMVIEINEDDEDEADNTRKNNKKEHPSISLQSLFDKFFEDEICLWNCSHCHTKDCSVKINKKIIYLSKYLMIQLKRFHYSSEKQLFQKIDSPIQFDFQYDLSKYFKSSSSSSSTNHHQDHDKDHSSSFFEQYHSLWKKSSPEQLQESMIAPPTNSLVSMWNKGPSKGVSFLLELSSLYEQIKKMQGNHGNEDDEQETTSSSSSSSSSSSTSPSSSRAIRYDLTAIIRHLGGDLMSGHYICDVRNQIHDLNGNKTMMKDDHGQEMNWIRYNDTIADPISEEKIIGDTETPYMFVFQRS